MKRKPTTPASNIAALFMHLSGGMNLSGNSSGTEMPPGMNAQLFPDGHFTSRDGRPASITGGALTAWRMDEGIALPLATLVAARKTPRAVDFARYCVTGKLTLWACQSFLSCWATHE